MNNILRGLVITLAVFAFFPSLSCADWRAFIPKPVTNNLIMELYGSYVTEKSISQTSTMEARDLFIKEKLKLESFGYSYNPRFIQYYLAVSASLKQEQFESTTSGSSGWTSASGYEYDARLLILPKHSYNLTLFARRYEPVYETQAAIITRHVQYNRGAIFQFDKKPYLFHANYMESSTETSFGSADVKQLHILGIYHREFKDGQMFRLSAGYDQTSYTSSSSNIEGMARSYNVGNEVGLSWVSLTSSLIKSYTTQKNALPGSFSPDVLSWYEVLRVDLPLNFTVNANYLYSKSTLTSVAAETSPDSSLSNTQKQIGLNVRHHIYRSLRSSYTFLRNSYFSAGGELNSTIHTFQTDYSKKIPWGHLYMGLSLGRSVSDSSGQTAFNNEPHDSDVPGFFVLKLEEPDRATIVVYMKSPVAPFELIRLVENRDYLVTSFGNTFQINMLTVPPPFSVPGKYEFFVSYSLTSAKFKLQSDSFNYNASLSLFNDTVNPYYLFSRIDSKVLSGNTGDVAEESISNTIGLILRKGPYNAVAEYQRMDSTVSPSRRWLGEVGFNKNFFETTTVHIAGRYTNTNYLQGISTVGRSAYTEQIASVISSVTWRPRVHLYLSANGAYSYRTTDLLRARSYTLGSSFFWRIGRLALSLNASIFGSDSETTTSITSNRQRKMLSIKIERLIF